jgi:hypothetical protein
LTAVIGDDTSMQVYNSNVPGTGQFYPPDCGAGQTADYGVFAEVLRPGHGVASTSTPIRAGAPRTPARLRWSP